MSTQNAISERLRYFRDNRLKCSQAAIASDLGISQSTFFYYESGRSDMSGAVLATMIVKYGLSAEWLYYGLGADVLPGQETLLEAASRRLQKHAPAGCGD